MSLFRCALKLRRRRAVPSGTVGGRIARMSKPFSCKALAVFNARSSVPRIIGTMCDCALEMWVFAYLMRLWSCVRRLSPSSEATISSDFCVRCACMGMGAVE